MAACITTKIRAPKAAVAVSGCALAVMLLAGCSWFDREVARLVVQPQKVKETRAKPIVALGEASPERRRVRMRKRLPAKGEAAGIRPAQTVQPNPPALSASRPLVSPRAQPGPPPLPGIEQGTRAGLVPAVPIEKNAAPLPSPAAVPASPPAAVPAKAQPSKPAPVQEDTLPTEPPQPPARPEPIPAPPNRVNTTPPRQSGGGMTSAFNSRGVPESSMRPAAGVSLMAPGRVPALNPAAAGAIGASRLEEARRLLVRGKVVDARSVLESALAITPAAALHELARTYDPYYLGMLSSIDDGSEPRRAAELYHEAIVHGSSAAGNDLDRLRASYPHTR